MLRSAGPRRRARPRGGASPQLKTYTGAFRREISTLAANPSRHREPQGTALLPAATESGLVSSKIPQVQRRSRKPPRSARPGGKRTGGRRSRTTRSRAPAWMTSPSESKSTTFPWTQAPARAVPATVSVSLSTSAASTCVEIKILRRVRPESSHRPPRHRRGARSTVAVPVPRRGEPGRPLHRREIS